MAGRGRGGFGRGRGMSFNIESLGFGRGEALPGPILQPPPLFEPLQYKPVPLNSGEECDYLLALKQEFKGTMRDSPYFIKALEKKKDIGRYSDKYSLSQHDQSKTWEPDWSRLPAELKPKRRGRKRVLKSAAKPNTSAASKRNAAAGGEDMVKNLEKLAEKEKKDAASEGEDKEDENAEDKKSNQDEEEEEIFDEDDLEDDTDYNLNYFDNGENFGADEDDDVDEGPIY